MTRIIFALLLMILTVCNGYGATALYTGEGAETRCKTDCANSKAVKYSNGCYIYFYNVKGCSCAQVGDNEWEMTVVGWTLESCGGGCYRTGAVTCSPCPRFAWSHPTNPSLCMTISDKDFLIYHLYKVPEREGLYCQTWGCAPNTKLRSWNNDGKAPWVCETPGDEFNYGLCACKEGYYLKGLGVNPSCEKCPGKGTTPSKDIITYNGYTYPLVGNGTVKLNFMERNNGSKACYITGNGNDIFEDDTGFFKIESGTTCNWQQ